MIEELTVSKEVEAKYGQLMNSIAEEIGQLIKTEYIKTPDVVMQDKGWSC